MGYTKVFKSYERLVVSSYVEACSLCTFIEYGVGAVFLRGCNEGPTVSAYESAAIRGSTLVEDDH